MAEQEGGQTAKHLTLGHFRNYEELDLELGPGIHLIAGANAQGKTNLLEALYLVSSTRLLRGQRDSEAIQEGFDQAFARVEMEPGSTSIAVALERNARKKVLVNGLGLPRASDVLGRLPCVCISSVDLPLVSGEPADRRMFLDLELSQLYAAYLRHLAVYKRSVEQRNALLKVAQVESVAAEQFEVWEADIARHGAAIRQFRRTFIENLTPYAQQAHSAMGSGEQLQLRYMLRDEGDTEAILAALLQNSRRQEVARGSTIFGPHKDDVTVEIAGKEGRLYGSQGQQRTAMLSLKLGTMKMEKGERGSAPLLLMDDILSDLDTGRRTRLMEWVLGHAGQTVLTCTEASAAGPAILSTARVIEIHEGKVLS